MEHERVPVLNAVQIDRKIERIAHQIIELNYLEDEVVLIGISKQGYTLAERILAQVDAHSEIKTHLLQLTMNKKKPLSGSYALSEDTSLLRGRSVILIDDVLSSGRTLIYAAREILKIPLKKLTTVVLVDRRHRKYPIKADFVGLTLSTTIQEHITVDLTPGKECAYLE